MLRCPDCRLVSALVLGWALLPAGLALAERSAAIEQLGRPDRSSERGLSGLEQIGSLERSQSGSVDQIDPTLSPLEEAEQDRLAPLSPGRSAASACAVGADQAAILQTLRIQGQYSGDDCELVDWITVSGDRSGRDERRERAAGALQAGIAAQGLEQPEGALEPRPAEDETANGDTGRPAGANLPDPRG